MKLFVAVPVATAMVVVTVSATESGNMNGKYVVNTGTRVAEQYEQDYAARGQEYFDVWAPEIATQYAQVFWTSQGTLKIPDDIVERFKGKVIAITGYEQDQVMVTPTGQPGVNPEQDVSVPINWAYNHHYMAWMAGAAAELVEVPSEGPYDWLAHGAPTKTIARPKNEEVTASNYPTSQMFSEGNGGESRKSYHGYPKGYAQLVESPTTWTITPMQIDTRNRKCGVTPQDLNKCTDFIPGPEPLQARYGRGIPQGTNYSGVLECPCNGGYGGDPSIYGESTLTKQVIETFTGSSQSCSSTSIIMDADSCFDGTASFLGINTVAITNITINSTTVPSGCTLSRNSKDGTVTASFNAAESSSTCVQSSTLIGETKFSATDVTIGLEMNADLSKYEYMHSQKGQYCSDNQLNVLGKFAMTTTGTEAAEKALGDCEAFCSKSTQCTVCSVDCSLGSMTQCQWVALPTCGITNTWQGLIAGDISSKFVNGNVTITMTGPSDAWFGVGFDAGQMRDQPYALIANASGIIEQKLGTCGSEADHCPGTQLSPTATLVSNDVTDNKRTVVVTRSLTGQSLQYYSFNMQMPTIPLISAVGTSQVFAYHMFHDHGHITVLDNNGSPSCVCDAGITGKMCNADGGDCSTFTKSCVPESGGGDLLFQKNPTCNSGQYAGGLKCCTHDRIMLDVNQTCESCTDLLRYHMKFRFWFEEFEPANATHNASHQNLNRYYYQTEGWAGEYDIPPAFATKDHPIPGYDNWPEDKPTLGTVCKGTCPNGPDCDCYHEITFRWESPGMKLLYAGGHCHAPACISLELYKNDTGKLELICGQYPIYGSGNVDNDKYDEAGYISIPPCLWGDEGDLEQPVPLPKGTPLVSIKRNVNTKTGHFGEMASWQTRGVPI